MADDQNVIKLALIEMDGKHETYGELYVSESGTMIRIGIRSSLAEGQEKRPQYAAHLGSHDAIRLASWILAAGIAMLSKESEWNPDGDVEGAE